MTAPDQVYIHVQTVCTIISIMSNNKIHININKSEKTQH